MVDLSECCDKDEHLSVWDYIVFATVLCISMGIGLFQACSGGKQKTTQEYLMANKRMMAVPVAMSLLASFFSSSTLLGTPAEIYLRGAEYWLSVFGAMMAPLIGAYLFGPLFHRLTFVSVYEYLEQRFEAKVARLFGTSLFIIRATIGMGIVIFGPAIALEAVTDIDAWITIILIGCVCAFYTSIGGMKAVIWTDVFQICIMLAGMFAAMIQGTIEVGGVSAVWDISVNGGRIFDVSFDPDPTIRHTFWTLVVGSFFVWLPPYTVDQQMVQRFSSARSLKHATWSLLLNVPGMFFIITICCYTGLIMYAYYAECDPLERGIIDDSNQLMPRFVMDIFDHAPGVPGLFIGSLFSGALSSVSSMLNSLAAVTWDDFFKLSSWARNMSDRGATIANKILAICYAIVGVGMAFLFSGVGGTVLQMSMAFNGAVGAPLVGIFVLGAFFPWANWIGLVVGGVLGFTVPMWINIGYYYFNPDVMEDLDRVNLCNETTNFTDITTTFLPTTTDTTEGLQNLHTLSYLWYTAVGILVTVIIGISVSLLTRCKLNTKAEPHLMISYIDKFWCCLPEKCKRPMRCGLDYTTVGENGEWEESNDRDMIANGDTLQMDNKLKPIESDNYVSTDISSECIGHYNTVSQD